MPHRCLLLTFGVLLAARISEGAGTSPAYAIIDLGTFFSGDDVQASAINNNGVVVGTDGSRGIGFYWDGSLHPLPPLSGDASSGPTAINSLGWIAGQSFSAPHLNGVVWINGTPSLLPVPGTSVHPSGINTAGTVVGTSGVGLSSRAFLVSHGASSSTDLGTLGGTTAEAYAINDAGAVVGSADTANENSRAFIWRAGQMTQLSDLGLSSAAFCINQQGIAGGFVLRPDFTRQAVLWAANGARSNLPNLAGAGDAEVWGVNQSGLAVGDANGVAALWSNGSVESLLTLVGANSGWNRLNMAYGVNDSGEIVGWGIRDNTGTDHAFLLVPVPEPGCLAFVGMFLFFFTRPIRCRVLSCKSS